MVYLSVGIFVLIGFLIWAFYRLSVKKDPNKRNIYIGFILVVLVLVVLYFFLHTEVVPGY
jgi:cell division protein FtsW (lipid II flippase)